MPYKIHVAQNEGVIFLTDDDDRVMATVTPIMPHTSVGTMIIADLFSAMVATFNATQLEAKLKQSVDGRGRDILLAAHETCPGCVTGDISHDPDCVKAYPGTS